MSFTYRANLTAAEFPFISDLQGRNVIIAGSDQNFSRQASSTKDKDRDIGIPQVYYCHNVMPTDAGMASVGYIQSAWAPPDTDNTFSKIFAIRDSSDNRAYLGVTTTGRNYVLLNGSTLWLRTTDVAPAAGYSVTTAYVNGITYIYYGKTGCYKYNFSTNTLDAVVLTSLVAANILGVCAANGYMIAWTDTAVSWSSTVTPTDFTPSLVTGAGGGSVQLAKANITVCAPSAAGFVAYTKVNAIAFLYTGNGQYPFNAKEVLGAGGVSNLAMVSYDGNSASQYVYSTSGLQAISGNSAQVILPEATDFLAGSQFEDFNETTCVFTQTSLGSPMQKKITLVANRYLVLSYGVSTLTHAIVYDLSFQRWGKLKIDHTDVIEYFVPSPNVVETPKRSVGFLQQDGTFKLLVMAYDLSLSYGVLVCGKYQIDRNTYVEMQEIHLENVRAGSTLGVSLLTTLDGKNYSVKPVTLASASGTYRRYNCRSSGINHSIVFSGAFHVASLELKFGTAGNVR